MEVFKEDKFVIDQMTYVPELLRKVKTEEQWRALLDTFARILFACNKTVKPEVVSYFKMAFKAYKHWQVVCKR